MDENKAHSFKRTNTGQVIVYANGAQTRTLKNRCIPAAGFGVVFGIEHPL